LNINSYAIKDLKGAWDSLKFDHRIYMFCSEISFRYIYRDSGMRNSEKKKLAHE